MDLYIVAIISFVAGVGVGVAAMLNRNEKQDGYCSDCKQMFRYDRRWNHLCPHCGTRIGIPPPAPWPHAKIPVRRNCGGSC